MQPASRAALATAGERFEERIATVAGEELQRLGTELGSVVAVLGAEPVIRRHLADPSASAQARRTMAEALFGAKVGRAALETLLDVVVLRWSRPRDLLDGTEELARQALLAVAERDGTLSEVEDELFRFGRVLTAEPVLTALLGNAGAPVQRRLELLDTVLSGRARPVTRLLLEQAVRTLGRRKLDEVVEELVHRAAARRERSVAHVSAGGPLSDQQEQRLLSALSRVYQRDIALKVELDPELLGGLVIRVGDEVIDGSVAGRLEKAHQWLPG
ncbi:MAG TPA: F0F1 ATP synthase subunit delta [Pseudonocardiaceae bacterium]|nr:F0F1 ATP synthase subunit delta [Pseudonocardiaceae bacterium]